MTNTVLSISVCFPAALENIARRKSECVKKKKIYPIVLLVVCVMAGIPYFILFIYLFIFCIYLFIFTTQETAQGHKKRC